MVTLLPNRNCLVYRWLYRGSYINMKKEDYEKKYKKLSKAVEKFLRKYNWGKMEYLEEDNGIGIGFFNKEDEPEHIKEISKLYKLL